MKEINISNLRQWLNEDKITDPKKMVTNEDLKHWLDFDFTEPIIKETIKAYNKGYADGLNLRKDYNDIKPEILEKVKTETLNEILAKIKALPITRPEYESDNYDAGLDDMKKQVLEIIEKKI